ncbi:MAG: ABC transporter permease [Phycisphaerae bacterium]
MSIRKLAAVARREYIETIKTKAFLFGVLLMPAIIVGMVFLSARMTVQAARRADPIRVAVVDHTGRVAVEMLRLAAEPTDGRRQVELEAVRPSADADRPRQELEQRVLDGSLFGVLEIPAEVIAGKGICTLRVRGAGMSNDPGRLRQLLNEAVKRIRFADAGIDAERIAALSRPVPVDQHDIRGRQEQAAETMANMMAPFVFVFLLFMSVFGVSQGLLTSVIEEKSSRVVEVLLSALSPFELMAGKILGMAGVGLTLVVLWSTVGYVAATVRHVQSLVRIDHLGEFILYYVLGYLLISSILAAVGSACNTLKEAQPLMAPLTFLLIIPLMFWMQVVHQPNATLAVILSLVPPMTPFIMVLRLTSGEATIPLWQQVAVPLWLAAWVLIAMWAAGRVFRVGLLMYGKPPGPAELVRWVRHR